MNDQPRTVTDAARALRAGDVTSVQLTQAAIAAADRLDARLGIYVTRFDERALAAAERADRELARGEDRGPLHGVPVGVKDLFATAGGPTTAQSVAVDGAWAEDRDAPAVARLRAAGAVLTGKTTTMELGCGAPHAAQPFPVPRNPWGPGSWTGGSSSGSASGVAAGLFLAGLGSDTGGSIRRPAAFCGVSGLMPTFGRVPKSGAIGLGYSLDRVGPLARSARDCAALLAALAGPHPSDPDAVQRAYEPPQLDGDLRGLRVGIVREHHFPDDRDPALDGAFDAALEALAARGAQLHEVTLPYWFEMTVALGVTAFSEALAWHRGATAREWERLVGSTRGLLATGAFASGADYVQAQRVRRIAQQALAQLFERVDAIATPTASIGAPRLDADCGVDLGAVYPHVHTPYWSMLGSPVLAVPIGFTAAGLPLSLQLAGPAFGEATVLRVGDALQRETDWHLRVPDLDAATAAPPAPAAGAQAPAGAPADPRTVERVRMLLEAAGLPAGAEEAAALALAYPPQRAGFDALHAVTAGDPALRFQAAPAPIADWGG